MFFNVRDFTLSAVFGFSAMTVNAHAQNAHVQGISNKELKKTSIANTSYSLSRVEVGEYGMKREGLTAVNREVVIPYATITFPSRQKYLLGYGKKQPILINFYTKKENIKKSTSLYELDVSNEFNTSNNYLDYHTDKILNRMIDKDIQFSSSSLVKNEVVSYGRDAILKGLASNNDYYAAFINSSLDKMQRIIASDPDGFLDEIKTYSNLKKSDDIKFTLPLNYFLKTYVFDGDLDLRPTIAVDEKTLRPILAESRFLLNLVNSLTAEEVRSFLDSENLILIEKMEDMASILVEKKRNPFRNNAKELLVENPNTHFENSFREAENFSLHPAVQSASPDLAYTNTDNEGSLSLGQPLKKTLQTTKHGGLTISVPEN